MPRKKTKYIHEGRYVAEVEVDLIEDDHEWAPYLSVDDASKLDEAREALRNKDLESASKYGRIYRMEPVTRS
ncbi:MAG: hypothetical protein R3220_08430 [Balneolaceae bacterium]|nr:hypothetical protein [Balneolaceae bacterium]